MADLNVALKTVFLHEGRLSDRQTDPGGLTNFGVSLRFLLRTGDLDKDGWLDGDVNHDGKLTAEDIREMTVAAAARLYDLYFWTKQGYNQINEQDIASKILSLAVNMDSPGANKCIQRALRSCNSSVILVDDGIFGARTIQEINRANPVKLMSAFKSESAGYYRSIKYKGAEDYLKGWLNRAYSDPVK